MNRQITENELKLAAKKLNLQYGLIELLINEVRKIQRQTNDLKLNDIKSNEQILVQLGFTPTEPNKKLLFDNIINQAMNEAAKQSYNQALSDFYYKLIVSSKYQDHKLECWSNKEEVLKQLTK